MRLLIGEPLAVADGVEERLRREELERDYLRFEVGSIIYIIGDPVDGVGGPEKKRARVVGTRGAKMTVSGPDYNRLLLPVCAVDRPRCLGYTASTASASHMDRAFLHRTHTFLVM